MPSVSHSGTEDDAERGGACRRQENEARQRDRRQMPDGSQLRVRIVKPDRILANPVDQIIGRSNLLHVDADGHRGDPMQARTGRIVDPQHNLAPSRRYRDVDAERPAQTPQAHNHAPRGFAVDEQHPRGERQKRDDVARAFVRRICVSQGGRLNDVHRIGAMPLLSAGRDVGLDHLGGVDDAIELGLADETKLQRGLLEGEIVVHRVMGNL